MLEFCWGWERLHSAQGVLRRYWVSFWVSFSSLPALAALPTSLMSPRGTSTLGSRPIIYSWQSNNFLRWPDSTWSAWSSLHSGQSDLHPLWMGRVGTAVLHLWLLLLRQRCGILFHRFQEVFSGGSTGHSSVVPWFQEQSHNLTFTGSRDTPTEQMALPPISCHFENLR